MDLKTANKELEQLDNEYEYWLSQKEIAKNMVIPKSADIQFERVDGGKREDRLLRYIELLDDKKIDETLDYIFKRKQNLMNWIDNELKILKKYKQTEQLIVFYKEQDPRNLSWYSISKLVNYSKDYCRKIYARYKKSRNV